MGILLIFAFLSGLVTIFAPCIWPLLPIILSSSSSGGNRKPLGITVGIMVSFLLLTLFLSYIEKIIPIDANALRLLAVIVIGFLGLTLIIPQLNRVVEGWVSRLTGKLGVLQNKKNGFMGGVVTGASLGVVWSPCAGPILATIATLAATQAVSFATVVVAAVYVLGVGIPLFAFATVGRRLFGQTKKANKYTGTAQKVFGVIMILTALAILTNYDRMIENKLLDFFPSYSSFLTKLETNSFVTKQLQALKGNKVIDQTKIQMPFPVAGQLPDLGKAPEFTGISHWLNSSPLTMSQLKGKVVLIDFWTYTCINCIRTLPHVTSWYEKYKDKGLVVVGVHTPEFEFEKDTKNVQNAINQYTIHYPVAQDNAYGTWNAYNNEYWPAEYLIDSKGEIRRTHFGEGEYDETETAIQQLLNEMGMNVAKDTVQLPDQTPHTSISPETYLGAQRMQYLYPDGSVGTGEKEFSLSDNPPENSFSYGGTWNIMDTYAVSGKDATLNYMFHASKVYLVLRPGSSNKNGVDIKVSLDGKPYTGGDVKDGVLHADTDNTYTMVDLGDATETHLLHLEFITPNTEVYAFTFG